MDGYGYMDGMLQDIPGWRGGGIGDATNSGVTEVRWFGIIFVYGTPPKTNMTMGNPPFEDVFPI